MKFEIRWIILVLALISLVKGDELWAAAGFVSFFLTFLPAIVKRELDVSVGIELEILIAIALLLHILGGTLELYTRYNWDYLTHFVSSMLIALIGLVSIYTIDRYAVSIELSPLALAFLTVVFTVAAGVLWEIGEFASDAFFGTTTQYSYYDTMHDLIIDALGGICVAVLAPRYVRGGRVERLLEVDLDMTKLKKPSFHWLIPCIMVVFFIHSIMSRNLVSLFFSGLLLALSFFPPIKSTSIAVESLFFVALLLWFFDDVIGYEYSYPAIIIMISFIFSYILDSLYGPSPWFLSFLVPIVSLFVSCMLEIVRFLGGSYITNGELMMNYIYVLGFSIPAGVAGWAFYDYMDRMKGRREYEKKHERT